MTEKGQNEILDQELSVEELAAVNGGNAKGKGGCFRAYYIEGCTATVEEGSWCHKDDYCYQHSSRYELTFDAVYKERYGR